MKNPLPSTTAGPKTQKPRKGHFWTMGKPVVFLNQIILTISREHMQFHTSENTVNCGHGLLVRADAPNSHWSAEGTTIHLGLCNKHLPPFLMDGAQERSSETPQTDVSETHCREPQLIPLLWWPTVAPSWFWDTPPPFQSNAVSLRSLPPQEISLKLIYTYVINFNSTQNCPRKGISQKWVEKPWKEAELSWM